MFDKNNPYTLRVEEINNERMLMYGVDYKTQKELFIYQSVCFERRSLQSDSNKKMPSEKRPIPLMKLWIFFPSEDQKPMNYVIPISLR